MVITYEDRKKLFDQMNILVRPEQEEILRILRRNRAVYTENSNGIFFDVCLLTDDVFQQIQEYLNFCSKTRQELDDRLKELETIRHHNETYVEEEDAHGSSR